MYQLVQHCDDHSFVTVKTFTKAWEALQYAETELVPGHYMVIPEYGSSGITCEFKVLSKGVLERHDSYWE